MSNDERPAWACMTCRFWIDMDKPFDLTPPTDAEREDRKGQCRRHAPRPFRIPEADKYDELSVWPLTFGGDYCGDHQGMSGPPMMLGNK